MKEFSKSFNFESTRNLEIVEEEDTYESSSNSVVYYLCALIQMSYYQIRVSSSPIVPFNLTFTKHALVLPL